MKLGSLDWEGGSGLSRDAARAASLFERACNGGNPEGCCKLGFAYAGGRGVPKDPDHANELFKKGCLYDNKEACKLIRR
jgi:hypothetical protein